MPLSEVIINISVETDQGRIVVKLSSVKGQELFLPTRLKESNIASSYNTFYNNVAVFQKKLKKITLSDWEHVNDVMNFLYDSGVQLNFEIFGEDYRREVEQFFKDAYPGWESSGMNEDPPKIIELITSDERLVLPFEFLPLFNTEENIPKINNADVLRKVAARFPGFSTIVKRVISPYRAYANNPPSNRQFMDTEIKNQQGLRVRHFIHANLDGAWMEQTFFKSTSGVKYIGPWPEKELPPTDFVKMLSSILWEGYDTNQPGQEVDHIQHFSCHCDTVKPNHTDYSIALATKKKSLIGSNFEERMITLGDLEKKAGSAARRNNQKTYPLIFLNACGASRFNPGTISSFPGHFLEIKNRGFIGTEANIPDLEAAEFTKIFYQRLLSQKTLGHSINLARWHFLLVRRNPVGLLYSVYANPDITVAKPGMVA
ncbi:MAG TPA: hypothetical protein VI461_18530 [Chitinophagaceae bacterium]|nr:hypothetical protein [Chitinophagaceae bacterium]